MADPLRRTLLAKLRGKKSKKGASVGGGYGSPAAEANWGREGKEKVLQTQRDCDEASPVALLSRLDCTTERMSTYENCVDGAMVQTGGVITVRESCAAELSGARSQEQSSGGRVRINEELLGVSLQRDVQFGGHVFREGDRIQQGTSSADKIAGSQVHRNHFVSVPRQCSIGDSIGFGDNSDHVLYRARLEPHTGVGQVTSGDSEGTEPRHRGHSRHMARCGVAVHEHNANLAFDNSPNLETISLNCAALVDPNCMTRNAEENILIRAIESYGPNYAADIRGTAGGLQSPAVFPTEFEICDITGTSLCATEGPLRYPLDKEDEDYYDNEILPFYETIRAKRDSDRAELTQSAQDKEQLDDGNSAQETDRLRNQLKEAYYLLINAMNDISLDVQQINSGLTEQQATSSCSSHSRDSLCSRLSAKNMDSDSWSSGGERSPQQVSDTDSLLLCFSGNLDSGLKSRLNSKSMVNLTLAKIRPRLPRSASDGAIRYPGGPSVCIQASEKQSPEIHYDKRATEIKEADGAIVRGVGELSDHNAISSDELLQGAGGKEECGGQLNDSSGSVSSLTCSSDSNADTPTNHGHGTKQDLNGVRVHGTDSVNKGHGVTVNKMQEWMHKGRLLSSEMKQRIEGLSLPHGGGQNQDRSCPQATLTGSKPGSQTSSHRGKSVKAKSPTVKSPQQQPAFIENVQTPYVNGREVGRINESSSWRPPLTTITVSKKRNWLQQSSIGKTHCTKDELQGMVGAEEDGSQGCHQPPPPPSPSPDHLRPPGRAPPRPVRLQLPQVSVGQAKVSPPPRRVDPAEENDADDEGEIWYNPIPEDDELEMSHRPSVRLLVPPRAEPQSKPSRAGGVAHGGRSLEGSGGAGPEVLIDSLSGGSGDRSQGNVVHSTEAPHLHRQMLVCKPQEEGGPSSSRATDGPDLPSAVGFSPPSSPNPTKKSSSINWSFPDKIKSPRTVRKISMKMKKLPELSRKLSVKGAPSSSNSNHGNGNSQLEPRAHSPRNNGSGSGTVLQTSGPPRLTASGGGQASCNVISRYHLDSSVSTQHSFSKKKSNGSSKSASKGGYLSDGDSPELVAKSGKNSSSEGKGGKGKEMEGGGSSKHSGTELDIDAFRHYSFTEQPKCSQYISGLMSLHFYGAEDLKPPRIDSLAVKLEPRGLIYVKLSLMEQWQNSLNGGPDGDREPQVFGVEAWRVVERENSGLMVPLLISKCITEIEKRGCQVVGLYRLCGSAAVKKELHEAFERDSHAVELCESMYPDINVITGVLKDYLRELPYPLITKQLYEAVLESMATRPLRMGAAGCENDQADSEHTVSLLETLPEVERMTLRMLLDHLKLVASYQEVNKMTCQNLAVCFGPVLLSQRQDASCHSNRVFIDSEELASALHFKKHIEVLHYLLQLWPVVDPHSQFSSPQPPAASLVPASSDLLSAPLRRRKERPQFLNLTDVEMAGVLRPKLGRLDSPSNRYAGDWSGCGESYFPSEILLPLSKEEADYDDVPSEDTETAEEGQEKPEDEEENKGQKVMSPDPTEQEQPPKGEEVKEEEKEEEEKPLESDDSGNGQLLEDEKEDKVCDHILPPPLPKDHTYQAYVKIQDISPVLSSRVNLRDLQESIDTLIGNLERELNKNKLNIGY
uniref:rho GTPase-activating protein SYDE2 n=1 Tax=Monopterus albus TaxID=43700 RepID=UPI0009B4D76D|nr:rho GTPase-activating protein SYDE2 [Monopterus albus]